MSVVMGVLILSFAVWGIADIFKGFGQSSLAKVGKTEISTEQFRQIYTDKLQQLGRSFGRPLTMEQARALVLLCVPGVLTGACGSSRFLSVSSPLPVAVCGCGLLRRWR